MLSAEVRDIRLVDNGDGRKTLIIEVVDADHRATLSFHGRLFIEPQPVAGKALTWDLHLAAANGTAPSHWGRFTVTPPETPDPPDPDCVRWR